MDKNVVGLSLQLDLESTTAQTAIEQVGQKAIKIQQQVSDAMQSAMSGISGSAGNAGGSLDSAVKTTSDLGKAGSSMAKGMAPYNQLRDEAVGLFEEELSRGAQYISMLKTLRSEILKKNKAHDEELGLVTDEVAMTGELGDGFADVQKNVKENEKALQRVRQTMQAVYMLVKDVDKATENFVTTNYRAYGSMQQLANEARYLQTTLGVTQEVGMSTMKALADVKTPIEQMDKLSVSVAKANRFTGVATETIAGYTLYLRQLGIGADGAEKQIQFMTDAMRKYGLTTNDVNSLMSRSGMQAMDMARLFGNSAEELAKFEMARISLAAMGKELGIAAGELDGFYDHLSSNVGAMQQFAAYSRVNIKTADDFNKALVQSGIQLENQLGALQARANAGDKGAANQLIAMEEALADAHFGGSVAALRAARQLGVVAKQMNLTGKNAEDLAKIMAVAKAKALDPFDESNAGLTAQLRILGEVISGTIQPFIQMLADGLGYLLMVVNKIIQPIAYVISLVSQFINYLRELPIIGHVVNLVLMLAAAIVALVVGLGALGTAIAAFAVSFGFLSGIISGAESVVQSFANMMVTMAQAVGQAMVALFTSLGQGLAALGNAVKGVLPQLIGLAFALLLVGAGMYLLGLGVSLVAEQGWMAVAAMFAMVAAMVVAIVALAVIAAIAGPVVPLIVALAFAVLLLGAAAMMAGIGFYLIGQSIQAVAEYGLQAATAISALVVPILLLGLAGLAAAPGLMLLGVALMLIAVPAFILATSFSILERAMESFVKYMPKLGSAGETLIYFAATLLAAVSIMFVAGVLMIPTSQALIVGSVLLTMAGIGMFAAGLSLTFGGVMLLVGAIAVAAAAVVLLPAAIAVFISGMLIFTGGLMLLLGAQFMLASAFVLTAASGALIVAAFALYFALAIFSPAVAAALIIGVMLLYAGLTMLAGATLILYAAQILYMGSVIMQASAVLFDQAMQLLLPAAMLSVIAGGYLLLGALRIIVASAMLAVAGLLLFYSAVMIMYASVMLYPAAMLLTLASIMLLVAGAYLTVAAIFADYAANILLPAATTLYIGGAVMLGAALMLFYAGLVLVPAAMMLTVGMFFLMYAILGFLAMADKIFLVGAGMKLLAQGFIMLASAPLSGFKAAAQAALSAMPILKKLVGELDTTAIGLQAAADKFTRPTNQIANSLNNLSAALANVGQGLDLASQIGELSVLLDQYSQLLETTAQRIEVAVVEKAQPAMSAARNSGLADAVRAETIDTVQVKTDVSGETEQIDGEGNLLAEQNDILRNILEMMGGYGQGNDLAEITDLLRDGIGGGSTSNGLASEFNQWMK